MTRRYVRSRPWVGRGRSSKGPSLGWVVSPSETGHMSVRDLVKITQRHATEVRELEDRLASAEREARALRSELARRDQH